MTKETLIEIRKAQKNLERKVLEEIRITKNGIVNFHRKKVSGYPVGESVTLFRRFGLQEMECGRGPYFENLLEEKPESANAYTILKGLELPYKYPVERNQWEYVIQYWRIEKWQLMKNFMAEVM